MGVAVVIVVVGTVYVFRVPPEENKHSTLILFGGAGALALVAISFVLGELSADKKTIKEAIITVIVEMAMLGLFILITNLLRKK